MSHTSKSTYCVGSPSFQPGVAANDDTKKHKFLGLLAKNDLSNASRVLFGLPQNDEYVYHATASVKLDEVQHVVNLGDVNGLHAWYKSDDGSQVRFAGRLEHSLALDSVY
jgi:hypothetical protein